jgi:hypothetical protein
MRPVRTISSVVLAAAVAVVSLLAAGCAAVPTVAAADRPVPHACGPATDAATARTVDVYVAVLQRLVATAERSVLQRLVATAERSGLPRTQYVVDHAVPGNAGMLPSPTVPQSTSTAPFAGSVKRCLASGRFPNLLPIRLVSGFDDPQVAKASRGGPLPVVTNGRVVTLAGVPPQGDRVAVAASSSGGGGTDAFGGVYILARQGRVWRVVQAQTWIA